MSRDPSLPPQPLALTEASVQEIQLELIRRHRFNFFNGPKIVTTLRRHRALWQAVLMHRPNWPLIKLRDLPRNYWNVDDQYILTKTLDDARASSNASPPTRIGKRTT